MKKKQLVTKDALERALAANDGRISFAAKHLGLSTRRMWMLLRKHDLAPTDDDIRRAYAESGSVSETASVTGTSWGHVQRILTQTKNDDPDPETAADDELNELLATIEEQIDAYLAKKKKFILKTITKQLEEAAK